MAVIDAWPLFVGAAVIGLIHGAEPGHGWPIAATYALDRRCKWFNGFLASLLLGIGHLASSIAVVLVYYLAISYFDLTQVNDPLTVFGLQIGGPASIAAGVLLILLGIREYRHGHSHDHEHDWESDTRGLVGITWAAFALGFAHEEQFEIIGLCTGSPDYCLWLMLVYSFAVIAALVGLTLGLVAGYERYEERVERYAEHFPTVSAVVLVVMGSGFIVGIF